MMIFFACAFIQAFIFNMTERLLLQSVDIVISPLGTITRRSSETKDFVFLRLSLNVFVHYTHASSRNLYNYIASSAWTSRSHTRLDSFFQFFLTKQFHLFSIFFVSRAHCADGFENAAAQPWLFVLLFFSLLFNVALASSSLLRATHFLLLGNSSRSLASSRFNMGKEWSLIASCGDRDDVWFLFSALRSSFWAEKSFQTFFLMLSWRKVKACEDEKVENFERKCSANFEQT